MKRSWSIILLTVILLGAFPTRAKAQIDTDRVISVGQNAIYFKDYVLAIQYFNSAISNAPHRADAYYYRGLAKYSLDDYLGAEEDSNAAIERNPFIFGAYYLRAISRHSLGKDSLALKDYKVVLGNNPDHQGALHNSALLQVSLKDSIGARSTLDHLQKYYPKYAPGYVIDGGLQLARGDTVGALNLFEKALQLDPNQPNAYLSMASIAYDRKEYKDAETYMDRAIEQMPDIAELFINRGLIRYQQYDYRGSMSDYSRAIEIAPQNTLALYNRALLRTQVGEINNAQEDLNRVVMLEPDNYFAIFNRALLSNEIGDYRMAVSDLDKIITRYPTFIPAYIQRADARRALGNSDGANRDIYHASKLMYDQGTHSKASSAQAIQDEKEKQAEEERVRDDRDKNIRKFRLLVYNSQSANYNKLYQDDEGIRGRIQDRDVIVEPEPMYTLSYYDVVDEKVRSNTNTQFSIDLQLPLSEYAILVVRRVPQLSQELIDQHLAWMNAFDPDVPQSAEAILKYGMDQVTLRDHEGAIATMSLIINEIPDDPAPYFQRAVSRFLSYEAERAEKDLKEHDKDQTTFPITIHEGQMSKEYIQMRAIADQSIKDLEKVLELVPNYAPAHYNIGYIQASLGQYLEAIESYTRAIESEPRMGAAYFNRGLSYYSIGDKVKGDSDLSQAGALGFYNAYSIIRRMK